jgi:hypothetical protein
MNEQPDRDLIASLPAEPISRVHHYFFGVIVSRPEPLVLQIGQN